MSDRRAARTRERVVELLRRDGRWLRSVTVIKRLTGMREVPNLDAALAAGRLRPDATVDEVEAWHIYVAAIVPLAHEAAAVEGEGNFGTGHPEEPPSDPAFTRVRATRGMPST